MPKTQSTEKVNYYQGCKGEIDPRHIDQFNFAKGFIIETKYDGHWVAVIKEGGVCRLVSRNGLVKTNEQLESLRKYAEEEMPDDSVLVGEMMFGTEAGTREALELGHHKVYIFDILINEGVDLSGESLMERKKFLTQVFKERRFNSDWIDLAPYKIEFCGKKVASYFKKIVDAGGEGVIAKSLTEVEPYKFGGKTKHWYKIKKSTTMDYVIMGYRETNSEEFAKKGWIGAIVCGLYEKGKLVEKVDVGSMDFYTRGLVSKNQQQYIGRVVEVGGNDVTKTGSTRHPFFIRFREDKDPEQCVWPV